MSVPTRTLERYAFAGLVAGLALTQLFIFMYVPLALGAVCWFTVLWRERRWPRVPAFFLPLVVLAAWTLVSSAFSGHPGASFFRDRQMLFYLVVPMTMAVARGRRALTAVDVIIAVGVVAAIWGVAQGLLTGGLGDLHERLHVFSHYMTYSGLMMLVFCAVAARLTFRPAEWVWPAIALAFIGFALGAAEARNAWIGAALGLGCLLAFKNWKLVIVVPIVLALVLGFGPSWIRTRALSIFDPAQETNRDRVSMLKSGLAMIKDHPLTGVGPNMVEKEYLDHYKRADAFDPADKPGSPRAHLHNVPVQLAAERGLPALAAWLWFILAACVELWRRARRGPARGLAAMGVAVVVAAVTAGLFEHNFGDSEFLVLFLGLITLPCAAGEPDDPSVSIAQPVPVLVRSGRSEANA